jgi:hypothetical protein
MEYKVTALRDVTIRAKVRSRAPRRVGDQTVLAPSEHDEWITLRAGETREHLGLVLGVHPASAPQGFAIEIEGVAIVIPDESWGPEQLPKEFFGLYRVEVQPSG